MGKKICDSFPTLYEIRFPSCEVQFETCSHFCHMRQWFKFRSVQLRQYLLEYLGSDVFTDFVKCFLLGAVYLFFFYLCLILLSLGSFPRFSG